MVRTGRNRRPPLAARSAWYSTVVVGIAGLWLASTAAAAGMCESASAAPDVQAALARLEASVDPCGESAIVLDVVRDFKRCAMRGYRLCRDRDSARNFIERGTPNSDVPTTITWTPGLRTELERGCGGSPGKPVLRDPLASLFHELVHAVQDCHGLDPAEHELEAVRIENIYRRAQGLCQRTRYGEALLPATMTMSCEPGNCQCAPSERHLWTAAQTIDPTAATEPLSAAGDVAASPNHTALPR